MAKTTKAQAARRGTKADPERAAREQQAAGTAGKKKAKAAAPANVPTRRDGRPVWYVKRLNTEELSSTEILTKRLYLAVQVLLGIIPVVTVISIFVSVGGFDLTAVLELFSDDPTYIVSVVLALAQFYVIYVVRKIYQRYVEGDIGYVAGNLVALLCCEIIMQSIVAIACVAVLLWRSWHRCSMGINRWQDERGFKGVLKDIAPSLVLFVLLVICLIVEIVLSLL